MTSANSIPDVLYKFTQQKYAQRLLQNGEFRIGTFRDYSNLEKHQMGIGDSEEALSPWAISNRTVATHDISPQNQEMVREMKRIGAISGDGRIVLSFGQVRQAKADCYCYTLSLTSDPAVMAKLSADYDCCIKITKPKEFIEVLAQDFKGNQRITCGSISGKCFYKPVPAEYGSYDYDKIKEIESVPSERWRLYFIKPLEFSYQEEFRIVWLPMNTLGLQPMLTQSLTAASMCRILYITDGI